MIRPILQIAAAAAIFLQNAAATSVNDSLEYVELRAKIMKRDPSNQALITSDALFGAGLFKEAADLLREHASEEKPEAVSASAALFPRTQWRVSSGVDYYHLEDLDTVTMTAEELRDYRRLTETPLSLWARAKASVKPQKGKPLEQIAPEAYLSERKGRLETAARIALAKERVRLEPLLKAEKWFRSDASGDSPFEAAKPQPSDMTGAAFRADFNDASIKASQPRLSIPLSVDWEHYRNDRSGYESFVEYRLFPSLELSQKTLHFMISTEAQFEDYYRKQSDTLDVVRLSGRVEANIQGKNRRADIRAAWMEDRYTKATSPAEIDRFEAAFKAEWLVAEIYTGRIRLRGIYENETHKNEIAFRRRGSEITVCPEMEASLFSKRLFIAPQLLWERRFGGDSVDRSVWYGRNALEPGLRAAWSGGNIDAAIRAAYRSERFDEQFRALPTTDDNRSLRANAELSVSPVTAFSFDLFADYQYRLYAPYGNKGRVSENLTVSGSMNVRW